jgi:hypothetical protein
MKKGGKKMNFKELIDLLYTKQGFTNRKQAANYLRLSEKGLQAIKAGRGAIKDKTVERLMKGTGLEAVEIVAAWEAEHGRTEAVRESWRRFLKNAAAVALPPFLMAIAAAEKLQNCILCKIRREVLEQEKKAVGRSHTFTA